MKTAYIKPIAYSIQVEDANEFLCISLTYTIRDYGGGHYQKIDSFGNIIEDWDEDPDTPDDPAVPVPAKQALGWSDIEIADW